MPQVAIIGLLETSTEFSAGYDLRAVNGCILQPGEHRVVDCGVKFALQANMAALVVPRSGLAAKHGVTVLNAPGLIDPDYTGEIKAIMVNLSEQAYAIEVGEKIAQLLFVPFFRPEFVHCEELPKTERGEGGLGSTGRV